MAQEIHIEVWRVSAVKVLYRAYYPRILTMRTQQSYFRASPTLAVLDLFSRTGIPAELSKIIVTLDMSEY